MHVNFIKISLVRFNLKYRSPNFEPIIIIIILDLSGFTKLNER